jgi:hypothetical protein
MMQSEWLELLNAQLKTQMEKLKTQMEKLKTQMEELKQEPQQLILNRHRPTCIIWTDSVRTPSPKATHCRSSWTRSDSGPGGGFGGGKKEERQRGRRRSPGGPSSAHQKLCDAAQPASTRQAFL